MVTRLEAAVDEVNKLYRKRTREVLKAPKPRPKPKTWKGKRVIPVEEWKSKEKAGGAEWRKFFPDRFLPHPFTDKTEDKQIIQYRDTWVREYFDFMRMHQDPDFGRWCCELCILYPDPKPLSTSIRDALAKTQRYKDNGRPFKAPCRVVNVFHCPLDRRDKDWDYLPVLGGAWEEVDIALKYSMELTEYKTSAYMVNFEKKTVVVYKSNGLHSQYHNEDVLTKIKYPKVLIKDHKDLYDAITNREKLKMVLDDYLEFLSTDKTNHTKENELRSIFIKSNYKLILGMFSYIRNEIKLEELIDPYGRTIQNAKDDNMIFLKDNDRYALPICGMSGTCATCSEFSNIRCVLCNAWLCLNHWREHGVMLHKLERPKE